MKNIITGAALLLASSSAFAGLITFDDTTVVQTTDWADTLRVSQFDASVGTLQSIAVTFSANMNTVMQLDNNNATAENVRGNISVLTLGSFQGLSLELDLLQNTGFQFLGADGSASEGYTSNTLNAMNSVTFNIDSADFSDFIGTGFLETSGLGTLGGFGVSGGGGNVLAQVATQAGANLSISYTYDDVTTDIPEPTSLALLGLGLMGFAASRKKKSL